jgi:hypothetical protein
MLSEVNDDIEQTATGDENACLDFVTLRELSFFLSFSGVEPSGEQFAREYQAK